MRAGPLGEGAAARARGCVDDIVAQEAARLGLVVGEDLFTRLIALDIGPCTRHRPRMAVARIV